MTVGGESIIYDEVQAKSDPLALNPDQGRGPFLGLKKSRIV